MAGCSATLQYDIGTSDAPDWRTAECGKLKNENGDAHEDGTLEHQDYNRGKTWTAGMDSRS